MRHTSGSLPPGPKRGFSPTRLLKISLDTLDYLASLVNEYGDIVHFKVGTKDVILINDPDLIRNVLVADHNHFVKGQGLEVLKHLLGEGLLTSEGEFHRRQRRLVQPSFHNERINLYANVMVNRAVQAQTAWKDGDVRDVAREMAHLTLGIAGTAFFDSDVKAETGEIINGLYHAVDLLKWMMLPVLGPHMLAFPPFKRRFHIVRARLDEIIYRLIAQHRSNGNGRCDLLSSLLMAQDEDRGHMTDVQIRDEVMTIILAGYETTANALTWTWYLLSQNPKVEAKLHEELDAVLNGRIATAEDFPRLPYTKAVLAESLRLYPPAWAISRRALKEFKIGDYVVPAGAAVMLCQFLVQRDPRHFAQPSLFYPERWLGASPAMCHRFAYFPFGGGQRACLGEAFAWTEGVLVLSTLASRWKLRLVGPSTVKLKPSITLRPRHGIKMAFTRRQVDAASVTSN